MSRYSVVDEPEIEENEVVLRLAAEDSPEAGPIFVCRITSFDTMTIDAFPEGQSAITDGEYRAEAKRAAMAYLDENVGLFEELFEEITRRSRG